MEYLSRLVVDEIQTMVFVAQPTPVGLTTVERISSLADSLPVCVHRKILVLNSTTPTSLPEGQQLSDRYVSGLETIVEVPFDSDVANRCARGEPISVSAAHEARPAIEELTRSCLGISSKQADTTVEESAL